MQCYAPILNQRLRRDFRSPEPILAGGRDLWCAEQRVIREGSSPSGARMRSSVSKGGDNSSLAGKEEGMEKPKRARRRKSETGGPEATACSSRRAGCPP